MADMLPPKSYRGGPLGDMALQSPEAVDIRGGRVTRLTLFHASKMDYLPGLFVIRSDRSPVSVSLVAPAAGLTIANEDGSGNPTFALANDLAALEALASTGFPARTAADSWALRSISGTTNRVSLTNGDGVSGNPTVDISASYVGQNTITTLGTVTTGTWNAGAVTSSGAIQATGQLRAGGLGGILTGAVTLANTKYSTWASDGSGCFGLLIVRDSSAGGLFVLLIDPYAAPTVTVISDPGALYGAGKWTIATGADYIRLTNGWGANRTHHSTFICTAGALTFTATN